jgi:aryl-alcohol dehydrogenase-like predicted oxidoreductase
MSPTSHADRRWLRTLGTTGLQLPALGFGAFKIGRNQGIKYPTGYELPDDATVDRLLNGALDLGLTLIDTAPAYGVSEERIGRCLARRRRDFVLSTKVGETFENGVSHYDYSGTAIRASLERSLRRLQTDVLDLVFIHSQGEDLAIQRETDVVSILQDFRQRGLIRAIGLSGKTVAGAELALDWADVVMVEYHLDDRSHEPVIAAAARRRAGVVVKKALASGRLPAREALDFVLANSAVDCAVIGGLNLEHLRDNVRAIHALRGDPGGDQR